ncbi:MAG: DUF262 domain-containing protein [Phaeodactylibacter sp.]|uniref:DUF262 domain-containing protein n=1 Tax=Phaeodactylibacter sp. TaxID=1940289 RepID=UPI0032EBF07B
MTKQASNYPVLSIEELLSKDQYVIPRYQRNYAWTEAHISQLIEDVLDNVGSPLPYYIGTLVVFPRKKDGKLNSYEVIDGQQRLTTLTLLSAYLTQKERNQGNNTRHWFDIINLDFESRQLSSDTLKQAHSGIWFDDKRKNESLEHNEEIAAACEIIARVLPHKCREKSVAVDQFKEYFLELVKICRVTVPDDTDLNHYFEIMNNRGEQLEKHEILKARLMKKLDEADQVAFGIIWDACADMDRYVQYGIKPEIRKAVFGKHWKSFPWDEDVFQMIKQSANIKSKEKEEKLSDVIESNYTSVANESSKEDPERFNSIINFPNFLLHAISIHMKSGVVPLDDKQLLEAFNGLEEPEEIQDFAEALLGLRFLFDQYIIKRDRELGEKEWSLKELHLTDSNNPSYRNAYRDEALQQHIVMLQSMFHVSVPSRSYKYWLQGALYGLYWKLEEDGEDTILNHLQSMAKAFVFDRFLARESLEYEEIIFQNQCEPTIERWSELNMDRTRYGEIQNILLFNYIDYLYWSKVNLYPEVKNFKYTFRSSIEHYYPQNPIGGDPITNGRFLHSIGNLCLISHGKNSQLRHHLPQAKKEYYDKQVEIDSIKQFLMLEKAQEWNVNPEQSIKEHEEEVENLLKQSLYD